MTPLFPDRREAGRQLAAKLISESSLAEAPVVLALPKGGAPVAFEIASALRAPLDICIVRQLEVPGIDGVVMGAIASEHVLVLRSTVIQTFGVPEQDVTSEVRKQARELLRRERAYRGQCAPYPITGRTVILVDDGLADSSKLLMAIAAVRARAPERVIAAMPVVASQSYRDLSALVDDVCCLETPNPFHAVATCYRDFTEVSDLDVRRFHAAAHQQVQGVEFVN